MPENKELEKYLASKKQLIPPASDDVELNKFLSQRKPAPLSSEFSSIESEYKLDSQYDPYLRQGMNQEQLRGERQGWGAETVNAIGGGIAKIPFSVIGNVASILDFEDYVNTDNEIGNSITAWAEEVKGNIEGATKIYKSNDNTLGSREWWMNNAKGLIDSAGGFVITGAGLGKGVQFLSQLAKGSKVIQGVGTVTNAAMLNQAESVPIAMKVYNDAINLGKSEEEAADAAAYSININRINIPLNLTSAFAFLRPIAATRQVAKDFSRKEILANLLKEGSQEYSEENINMIAEKEAIRKATDGNKYSYNFDNTINDVLSKEGFETGLVGFIGGAVQTAGTDLIGHLQKDAPSYDIDGNVRTNELGQPIKVSRITSQKERFKAQQKSLNNIELLSKGQNVSTIKETLDKVKITSEILNDIQIASIANDDVKVDELKNKLLSVQALDAFKNGTTEQLINLYKSIQRDPSSKDKLGDDFMIKASQAIKDIETLEKVYQEHQHLPQVNEVFNNRSDYAYNLKEASRLKSAMFQAQAEQAKEIEITGYNTEDKINSLQTTKELVDIQDKFKQVKDNVIKLNDEFNKIITEKYTKKIVKEKETVAKETAKENKEQTIESFIERFKNGETSQSEEDLQFYENNKKEIEAILIAESKKEETPPVPSDIITLNRDKEIEEDIEELPTADQLKDGQQMFPNTRTISSENKVIPNQERERISKETKGVLYTSKQIQDIIDENGINFINNNITIDAINYKGSKAIRIKLGVGDNVLGYFQTRDEKGVARHTKEIQDIADSINIGDVLDNKAVKALGFTLNISNGYIASSDTALTLDALNQDVIQTGQGLLIFDQGTVSARAKQLPTEMITDAVANSEQATMPQMNLGRYVLKFYDKSGNPKYLPIQSSVLTTEETDKYLNSLRDLSNKVVKDKPSQIELDELNTQFDKVFISIPKSELTEPTEVDIDISPKGAIRIRLFKYESNGKLKNEPFETVYINNNEMNPDNNGLINDINNKFAFNKKSNLKLDSNSFRHSIPKKQSGLNSETLATKFQAFTTSSVLEGQDVLISVNKEAAKLATVSITEVKEEVKLEVSETKETVELDDLFNEDVDQEIKSPDTDIPALKLADNTINELIDSNELEEIKRITPKEISTQVVDDLKSMLQNVADTKTPWGFFKNKVIYLSNQAGSGTGFHEAFHAIFRFAISNNDVDRYLKLAEKEVLAKLNTQDKLNSALSELRASSADYQDLSPKQIYHLLLEEHMADRYMEYTKSAESVRTSTGLKQLFRRISNLVKSLLGINDKLEAFFDKIDRGAFSSTKAVANKQTFVSTLAYKNLIAGVDSFMTSTKSKKIINTFAARIKQKSRQASFVSNEQTLEDLIKERLELLKTKGLPYIKSITDETVKAKLTKALTEEVFTLRNTSAKTLLVEQINKRLELFDVAKIVDSQEDENDDDIDAIGDETGEIGGSKEAWTISLEEGTNKVIREYIAFAMYTTIDELTNEPVLISVDNQVIYNGLAHTLANTPEDKMMAKFIDYARNNEQAKAVLDMISSDTGMVVDYTTGELVMSPTKNFNDFRKIITAFKNVKIEFLHTSFNPEYTFDGLLKSNEVRVTNANLNTAEKISINNWANSLFSISKYNVTDENRKEFWTTKINDLTKAYNSGVIKDIKLAFKEIGINVSNGYIEFSLNKAKPISKLSEHEVKRLSLYGEDVTPINIDDFKTGEFSFKNILILGNNPYNTGEEGMSSRLSKMASSNGEFDESIQASNFKGADGNTRYDIIKSSYVLDETIRLRNISYRNQLVTKYPILKDNLLLKNTSLLRKLKVSLIDGVRNQATDDEGSVFGDYSEREYLYQHIGFWFGQKKGKVQTLFRQNEASNTAYVAELEVNNYITDNSINDKAVDNIYSFFNAEYNRILSAEKGNIKGYNIKESDRAFRFTEFSNLLSILGPVKYNQITNSALSKQKLSDDLVKDVKAAIKQQFNNEIKQFKEILNSNGFASFSNGVITSNNILPTHLNGGLLSYPNLTTQLEEMYINNYINSFTLNQLFDGDYALSRDDKGGVIKNIKDINSDNMIDVIVPKQALPIDIVKRNKGAMGSGSDLGNGTHKVAYIKDVNVFVTKEDGKLVRTETGEKINSNDAQSYTNVNHIMFMTERLGRMSEDVKTILRKIRRGIDITSKEQLVLEAAQASLNPWKTVTFGREFYIKTSEAVISRHEVSHISDIDKYNEIMNDLEEYENTRLLTKEDLLGYNKLLLELYTPIKGKEFYHNMLNQMDIHGIDQIVTESASKGMTLNPQDSMSIDLDLSLSMIEIPNSYKRLQVETPTGKNVITAGTQLMQLIDSEQNDSIIISLNGINTSIGDVRVQYRKSMANTRDNSFKLAEAYLKDGTNNANLKKKFIKALESSGADEQLLEIFNLNWNLLPAIDKAEQLFLSHFGGGILAQKVPGTKVSLMSDAHWNVVVDGNDKVILNKSVKTGVKGVSTRKLYHNAIDPVTGQVYSECILSEKVFSKFGLNIGDEIPVDVATMLGYRIPTQDKHSMIALRVVDVLPNYLEGTGIFPAEIVLLSGADFDIDSLFIQQPSFTMDGDKAIKAGNELNRTQRWNAFLDYFHKNKLLDGEYQDRLKNQLRYKELSKIKKKDRRGEETIELNSIKDEIRRNVLEYFKLPITEVEFNKSILEGKQLNNNVLNNDILDAELALLTNEGMKDIALTPVSSKPMEDVANDIIKLKGEEGKQTYSSSSMLGMFNSNSQNSAGKAGIGPVANALQAFTFLAKNNISRKIDFIKSSQKGAETSAVPLIINNKELSKFDYTNEEKTNIIDKTNKINIWAGSNENSILSNLAIRPFVFQNDKYNSVEEYFQIQKSNYLKEELYKDGNEAKLKEVVEHNNKVLNEIIKNENNPFKIKLLGRQFKGLDTKAWDKIALNEMEKVLKISFEQNPKSLEALKNTGNSLLTHTQDSGRWKNDFPNLLMKIRDDLFGNKKSQRIADTLSTILSVMTDNAKDPIAGKMGLSLEILTPFNYLISLGVSLKDAALIINTPSVQMYAKMLKESKYALKSKEEQFKSKKTNLDELFNKILGQGKNSKVDVGTYKAIYKNSDIDTSTLETIISEGINDTNRDLNIQTLVKFIQIEEEAKNFQDLNNLIKLTKGLPTSFLDVDKGMYESLYNLGLEELFNLPARETKSIPAFNLNEAVREDKLLYSNIISALKVIKHSEKIFVTETHQAKNEFKTLLANIKSTISKDKIKELKRNFLGFISTNAYVKLRKQELGDFNPTNDALLFPELEGTTLAVELIKLQNSSNDKIRNNQLIKWLKPELKFNAEEELIDTKHVFDKVSGKSFIKLSQESINDLVNSFVDLWNDETTKQFSVDLFHYLITKDNLEYKNDSFIKYIAPFMFNNVSRALDVELKGLNEGTLTAELSEQAKQFRMILAAYKPTQESYIQKINADQVGYNIKQSSINFTIDSNRSMFEMKAIKEGDVSIELYKFPEFIVIKTSDGNKLFYNDLKGQTEDWNEQANYVPIKSAGYKSISPFSKSTYNEFIKTYDVIDAAKSKRFKTKQAKEEQSLISGADEANNIDNSEIPEQIVNKTENNLESSDKNSILYKNETTNSGIKISELYDKNTWDSFEQIKKDYIKKCN